MGCDSQGSIVDAERTGVAEHLYGATDSCASPASNRLGAGLARDPSGDEANEAYDVEMRPVSQGPPRLGIHREVARTSHSYRYVFDAPPNPINAGR